MKNKNFKLNEFLFFIGYVLLIVPVVLTRVTMLSQINYWVKNLSYIILLIPALMNLNIKSRKKLFEITIMMVISIITFINTGDLIPIKLIVILLAGRNIDFNKFIKRDFYLKILLISIVLICHNLGLTNDYNMITSSGIIRNSMGFTHPNVFGFYLMIICFEYIYLKHITKSKLNFLRYILLFIVIMIINYYSYSRSSIVAIAIFIILMLLRNNIFKFKTIGKVFNHTFGILTILTVVVMILYQQHDSLAIFINEITSKRVFFVNYFYKKYGISLFGQKIVTITTEQARILGKPAIILDNSNMLLLIKYGVLMYLVYSKLFFDSLKYSFKNNKVMYILLITLIIYGISESNVLIIEMCPFLMYFNTVLFNNKEGKI